MANNNETTTKFKVDISELKSAMQEAKRQISLTNSEFKAISSSMADWSKSTDGIKAKLTQLNSNLNSQKAVLSQYEKTLEEVKKEYGENSKEAQQYQTKLNNQKAVVNKTESEIKKFEGSLSKVAEAEKIASKTGKDVNDVLDEMEREASEADKGLDELSDGFTVMKGALASLVADGIKTAISALKDMASSVVDIGSGFGSSMSEVQAISGASAEELAQLEKTAREFGSTTVFSASESAQALKYMALAGWSVEQSTSALGGVLNLASASGMELAQASDMVTDYLSAFGLQAKDSAMFADMLAYAQSNSNTSAEQLGEAFKNCAANLNAGGQDVQTTTALLASMANQGLKGSEAGTALTAMMRDMTAKMKDGKIAIGDTNVEVMDANGNYRDLTDILKDVESATDGMGDAEKATALSSTFTADSIRGLNLILNDGVDKSAEFEESLRNSSGTAENMAETMNDNLAGDIKSFQSAIEELALKVYDALEPALRDIIAFVQKLANQFNEWLADPANKKAIDELGAKLTAFVEGALTTIMEFIKWFIDNKDLVIAGVIAIGTAFVAWNVASMIMGVVTAFKTFITALQTGKTVMQALNLVMSANPIGILITLLAGLVAGFIYLWNTSDEFRAFWINLFETIKSACITALEAISTFFTESLPNAFTSVIDWIKENWTTLLTFLVNPFAGLFKYFYENNKEFKKFVDNAVKAIKEMPAKVWTWLQNTIAKVTTFIKNMKAKATEAGKNFVVSMVNKIRELPAKIWTWFTNVITKVNNFASNLKTKATEAGKNFTKNLIDNVKKLPDKIKSVGGDVVKGLWEGMNNKVKWLKDKISDFVGNVTTWLKKFFKISSPSKLMADEIGQWLPKGIAVGIDDNADSVLSSVKNLTANTLGATRQGLNSAITPTNGITGGVVNNFYQTNNSPKALSRLEIYRQSKNLLGFAGGV